VRPGNETSPTPLVLDVVTSGFVGPQDQTFREGPPRWRGRLHSWAFVCSRPAGVALVLLAGPATARIAVAVYVVSLAALFGTSAAYHRLARSSTATRRLQRLDHSMIYVLIAGTYTPLCVVALPPAWGIPVLAAVWGGASVGVVVKAAGINRLGGVANALDIVLGWAAVVALPVVVASIPASGLGLMVTGGVAYTVGAVVFLRGRPDPRPDVFGFHEVWHACTVIGAVSHFAMVWLIAA
jgi:hemolysin III